MAVLHPYDPYTVSASDVVLKPFNTGPQCALKCALEDFASNTHCSQYVFKVDNVQGGLHNYSIAQCELHLFEMFQTNIESGLDAHSILIHFHVH